MSTRITVKDVRIMFERARRAATAVGIDATYWDLAEGDALNGIAYRVHDVGRPGEGTGRCNTVLGYDFLGMTAKEAYRTLLTYAYAWEAVAYVKTIA